MDVKRRSLNTMLTCTCTCDYGGSLNTMLTCTCTCDYGGSLNTMLTCTVHVIMDAKKGSLNTMLTCTCTCTCDYGCKKGIFEYYAYLYMYM